MKSEEQIRAQYRVIRDSLDERGRREWAASEAIALGYGGIALVHRGTGIVPSTIGKGIKELREREAIGAKPEQRRRVRRPGGGRRSKVAEDPQLLGALEALIEPSTRGDPESPLRWTCRSLRELAAALTRAGHEISYRTVARLLKSLNYSLRLETGRFQVRLDGTDGVRVDADTLKFIIDGIDPRSVRRFKRYRSSRADLRVVP